MKNESESVMAALQDMNAWINVYVTDPTQQEYVGKLVEELVRSIGALYIAGAKNPDTVNIYKSLRAAVELYEGDPSIIPRP